MALSSQSSMRKGKRLARVGSRLPLAGVLAAAGLAPEMTRTNNSCRWAGLMGLVRQLAKPAQATSGWSERTPTEVSNTSGNEAAPGSLRISRARAQPFQGLRPALRPAGNHTPVGGLHR